MDYYEKYEDYEVNRNRNRNQKIDRKQRMIEHSRGLKTVILPLLAKKAKNE